MNNNFNLSGFINFKKATIFELWKAYVEGVYSDTPANRKLGRVGMTYVEYTKKTQAKQQEEEKEKEITAKTQAEKERKSKLNPPKEMSEGMRKKNFSEYKPGDTIYLPDTHKSNEGNFTISEIKKMSPTSNLIVVNVEDSEGKSYTFLDDYLRGKDPFEGFKIMDLNYSLQEKPAEFMSKVEALDNFNSQLTKMVTERWGIDLTADEIKKQNEFVREDIKVAIGSVPDFEKKTENIAVESWGVTIETRYKGKAEIFTIEPTGKTTYKISKFTPTSTTNFEDGKYEAHPDFPGTMTAKELKNAVKKLYDNSK